jgi:hypothetical protein
MLGRKLDMRSLVRLAAFAVALAAAGVAAAADDGAAIKELTPTGRLRVRDKPGDDVLGCVDVGETRRARSWAGRNGDHALKSARHNRRQPPAQPQ